MDCPQCDNCFGVRICTCWVDSITDELESMVAQQEETNTLLEKIVASLQAYETRELP